MLSSFSAHALNLMISPCSLQCGDGGGWWWVGERRLQIQVSKSLFQSELGGGGASGPPMGEGDIAVEK